MLTLQCSVTSFAFVPPKWARVITISMDPATLTAFGQDRLAERLAELEPSRERAGLTSLAEVFDLIPARSTLPSSRVIPSAAPGA